MLDLGDFGSRFEGLLGSGAGCYALPCSIICSRRTTERVRLVCRWALRLAADAAVTVLKVDQIIMAKQAGGPKPRAPNPMDDD